MDAPGPPPAQERVLAEVGCAVGQTETGKALLVWGGTVASAASSGPSPAPLMVSAHQTPAVTQLLPLLSVWPQVLKFFYRVIIGTRAAPHNGLTSAISSSQSRDPTTCPLCENSLEVQFLIHGSIRQCFRFTWSLLEIFLGLFLTVPTHILLLLTFYSGFPLWQAILPMLGSPEQSPEVAPRSPQGPVG